MLTLLHFRRLAKKLVREGHDVILFDVNPPREDVPDGATFIKGDLRKSDEVFKAAEGVDLVYHVASYGEQNLAPRMGTCTTCCCCCLIHAWTMGLLHGCKIL